MAAEGGGVTDACIVADHPAEQWVSGKDAIAKLKEKFIPGVKYTLLISFAFNFITLIIGSTHVHQCPVREEIALFVIAIGGIGIMSAIISYTRERITNRMKIKYFESALYTSQTIFLLLGIYWVFPEYQPSYNPADGDKYCSKTLYMYAFVYITIVLLIPLVILFGFCCFMICICFLAKNAEVNIEVGNDEENKDEKDTTQANPIANV